VDVVEQPKLHDFLGQELLTIASHTDGGRCSMFAQNLTQSLILSEGEFPLLFTGYERHLWGPQGFQMVDSRIKILNVIHKNKFKYMVVYVDGDGVLDCCEISLYRNSTQEFGYRVNANVSEGAVLNRGSLLWHSSNFDSQLNPLMGRNLNTAYQSWGNMTYEDAVVISESTAAKLASDNVNILYITLNTNDTPLPLYADNRVLPNIGDPIKDFVIMASRRWSTEELFTDFTRSRMTRVNPIKDVCYYARGTLIDITLYSNCPSQKWDQMLINPQMHQLNVMMQEQNQYYRKVLDVLGPYVENDLGRKPNVNFFYARFKRAMSQDFKWTYDSRRFDHLVLEVVIAHKNTVQPGAKLVNRFGGKGCVSTILKDFSPDPKLQKEYGPNMMPCGQDGTSVDVILSPLGIIGRLNPSSLYELELNRIAAKVTEAVFAGSRPISDLFHMIALLDPDWGDVVSRNYDDNPQAMMESIGTHGPYLRVKPFWNGLNIRLLRELYRLYPEGKPSPLFLPHLNAFTRRPVVVGKMMIQRLEHDPVTKFISRGAGIINPSTNMPGKSRRHREGLELFNPTPVRAGEHEQFNLLLLMGENPEYLRRWLNSRSTNREDRQKLLSAMLQGRMNELTVDEFDQTPNRNREILEAYMLMVGLHIRQKEFV
jgi:DNA-directed RNA polymerase beta subunit